MVFLGLSRSLAVKFTAVLCVVLLQVLTVVDAQDLCRQLSEMTGVNSDFMSQLGYNFDSGNTYFCAPTAPEQFYCTCGAAGICEEQLDPFGRDVGVCGCCPVWIWIVLGVFALLILSSVVLVSYACCCRGRWWCDGYPEPIQPILPRRGPPVVAPAGMPLPHNLFRGYRISDFVSQPLNAERNSGDGSAGAAFGSRRGTASVEIGAELLPDSAGRRRIRLPSQNGDPALRSSAQRRRYTNQPVTSSDSGGAPSQNPSDGAISEAPPLADGAQSRDGTNAVSSAVAIPNSPDASLREQLPPQTSPALRLTLSPPGAARPTSTGSTERRRTNGGSSRSAGEVDINLL